MEIYHDFKAFSPNRCTDKCISNKYPNENWHAASKVFTEMQMTYSCQNNVAKEKKKLDFEAYYKTTLFKAVCDLA